jgi:hypothetical protein
LRLFVTGAIWEGSAVMVRMYAGSKEPDSRRQVEWERVMRMLDSGRW